MTATNNSNNTSNITKDNYTMFREVVNNLQYSQGFYGRIQRQLQQMDDDQLQEVKEYFNRLPQFKDSIDVILHLEQ